eukprot:1658599-Pleurochrysis_carterae.AAC.1
MGTTYVASGGPPGPCRRWVSPRGRCAGGHRYRWWRTLAGRDSTTLRPLAARPGDMLQQSPTGT